MTIVVTDGYSTTGVEFVKDKANLMKNAGIEIFAIGITKRMRDEELVILSSEPVKNHFFRLSDSNSVKGIADSIIKQVCK